MSTNLKLAVFALICSIPLFVGVYPSFWEWMAMPVDSALPAVRIFAISIISISVFWSIYATGHFVVGIGAKEE